MPIRPENRQAHWGATETSLLFPHEVEHIEGVRAIGFDPLSAPQFWEALVARHIGGEVTSHNSEHDVEVIINGALTLVEVKFSAGFRCAFSPISGRDRSREVFKWARPRGYGGKDAVDAIILIGRALSGLIYAWVLPREEIARRCASVTVQCPESRSTDGWRWDRFAVPFDQLLPAVARIARGWQPPPGLPRREAERRRIADKAGQLRFEVECFGKAAGE